MAKRQRGGENRPEVTIKLQVRNAKTPSQPLQLGFVPLTDCAPLVMAHELGLFRVSERQHTRGSAKVQSRSTALLSTI